jgi:adenine-specific DNA methylase
MVAMASFESRETGFLPTLHTTKERFIRLVQTTQRILQHLTEDRCNVWSSLFNVRQLVDLVEYTNGCAVLPRSDTFL